LQYLVPEMTKYVWNGVGLSLSHGTKKPFQINPSQQVFLFFRWSRHHPSERYMASDAHCHQTTVHRNNMRILFLLRIIFRRYQVISIPPLELRQLFYNLSLHGLEIAVLLDGHHQCIPEPSDSKLVRNAYWSGKEKNYTLLLLLFISPTGLIYAITSSYPGSCTDKQLWDFPETKECVAWLSSEEAALADLGFLGMQHDVPTIMPLKGKLTLNQTHYNSLVSSFRVKVEQVLGEVQQWAVCKDLFTMPAFNPFNHLGGLRESSEYKAKRMAYVKKEKVLRVSRK